MRNILFVDDQPIVLNACRHATLQLEGYAPHLARNASEALDAFTRIAPDLVITDINLPDLDGIELSRRIHSLDPNAWLALLSTNDSPLLVLRALTAGFRGFISKADDIDELKEAIVAINHGDIWLSRSLREAVPAFRNTSPTALFQLSSRELDILRSLAHGRTLSEVASELGLAPKTLSNSATKLRRKLGATSSESLVRYARDMSVV